MIIQVIGLALVCTFGVVAARYASVPMEDLTDVREFGRLRMPRGATSYGALRGPRRAPPEERASEERRGEYVDFGAHTGSRGAYGWHVDFPVQLNY